MKLISLATISILLFPAMTYSNPVAAQAADVPGHAQRSAANRDRDAERQPNAILDFIDLSSGDSVLDWGAGGGYWSELFAIEVGKHGRVYAQQRPGQRFEARKAEFQALVEAFDNIELTLVADGEALPLADNSIDTIMLSYLYHHMHFDAGAGESLPKNSAALLGEFRRVLKPGGTLIVIEHQAAAGSGRAQSAAWHRTPAEMAKADITGAGFDFAGEAPNIYKNPEDDEMNMWGQTGLRGKTTSFVHKYRVPE